MGRGEVRELTVDYEEEESGLGIDWDYKRGGLTVDSGIFFKYGA